MAGAVPGNVSSAVRPPAAPWPPASLPHVPSHRHHASSHDATMTSCPWRREEGGRQAATSSGEPCSPALSAPGAAMRVGRSEGYPGPERVRPRSPPRTDGHRTSVRWMRFRRTQSPGHGCASGGAIPCSAGVPASRLLSLPRSMINGTPQCDHLIMHMGGTAVAIPPFSRAIHSHHAHSWDRKLTRSSQDYWAPSSPGHADPVRSHLFPRPPPGGEQDLSGHRSSPGRSDGSVPTPHPHASVPDWSGR